MKKETRGAGHHVPVLLDTAIQGLNPKHDGWYIDGTFGRGGHSGALLKNLGPEGRLLAIDRDPEAIRLGAATFDDEPRLELLHGEFSEIKRYARERDVLGKVDGLLLDLGVSSPQLDTAERGFSFQSDGPLDMRMDPGSGLSAAEWIATVDEKTLKRVLQKFGEERFSGRIARAIVAARETEAISRTMQLAQIVRDAVPAGPSRKHPATQTFQAIRIFLNAELRELTQALEDSLDVLAPHGRLCVISFHSLEDRAVKRFMRSNSRDAEPYRGLPDIPADYRAKLKLVGKAQSPNEREVASNPRARSSRLRVAERV